MKCRVIESSDIDGRLCQEMYNLHQLYFDGISKGVFISDLKAKDWAIVLEDDSGLVCGFTMLAMHLIDIEGQTFRVFTSGDTITSKEHWNDSSINSKWLMHVDEIMSDDPTLKSYWLLICSGFRTYRYMPVFWRDYVPKVSEGGAYDLLRLRDEFSKVIYKESYDAERGLVLFDKPQILKSGVSQVTQARLKNRHVAYFAKINPRFEFGDELVCLTEMSYGNQTNACRRLHTMFQNKKLHV